MGMERQAGQSAVGFYPESREMSMEGFKQKNAIRFWDKIQSLLWKIRQQNKNTTYKIEKDICKPYIWWGITIQNILFRKLLQLNSKKPNNPI